MAKVRVSLKLLDDLIFGYTENPVQVKHVYLESSPFHSDEYLVFDIEGEDVPNVSHVTALCSMRVNRAHQRFVSMTFEATKDFDAKFIYFSVVRDKHGQIICLGTSEMLTQADQNALKTLSLADVPSDCIIVQLSRSSWKFDFLKA